MTKSLIYATRYLIRLLILIAAAVIQPAAELSFIHDELDQDIYVESRISSNCELNFEGVLHFDGYSLGNVLSPSGTLVLPAAARSRRISTWASP